MSLKLTNNDAGPQLRGAAEDAGWGVRQAAWSLEEKVLWRASDVARSALRRALRAVQPLQRLIQTRIAWPLADRMDDYGSGVRTAVATAGVVAALGAGAAGAFVGSGGAPAGQNDPGPVLAATPAAAGETLQGVTPDFVSDPNQSAEAGAKAAVGAKPAAPPAGAEAKSPDAVAWRFAQAFVLYEVGEVDRKVTETFRRSASPPLAAALKTEPPRLPSGKKVPTAQVLNVVLGAKEGKEMTASVSLLRLKAASELSLTLREGERGWRVTGVLG